MNFVGNRNLTRGREEADVISRDNRRFFPLRLVGASYAMSIGVGWETPSEDRSNSDCNIGLSLIFVWCHLR